MLYSRARRSDPSGSKAAPRVPSMRGGCGRRGSLPPPPPPDLDSLGRNCGKAELWLSPFFKALRFDILAKFQIDSGELW